MSTEETARFSSSLEMILEDCHGSKLAGLVDDVADYCFQEKVRCEPSHSDCLDLAINTIGDPRLQELEDAYQFLLLFQFDWGCLSDDQQQRLLEAIAINYDRFKDSMAYHVQAELLGRFFCDSRSLGTLQRLAKTSNETARALVPLGLDSLARETSDPNLRRSALAELSILQDDPSPEVRAEVAESFKRIAKATGEP